MIEIRVINSASAVNIITDFCLQLIQKIRLSANLKIKLNTEHLLSLLAVKSESEQLIICSDFNKYILSLVTANRPLRGLPSL